MYTKLQHFIYFLCFVFQFSCKQKEAPFLVKTINPDTLYACQIISTIDSLPPYIKIITGFEFPCGKEVKSYNFRAHNPWKNLPFPVITLSNRFLGTNYQSEFSRKGGNYEYYLHYAPFNEAAKYFSVDEDNALQQYYCTLAMASTYSTNYSPFGAVVSYFMDIMATSDTIKREGLQIVKTSGQLIVLNKFGQITYELFEKEYGMAGPVLDTLSGLLLFKTFKIEKLSEVFGLEIHSLGDNTCIFDTLLTSSFFITDPKQTGRFILLEIWQKPEYNRKKVIIVDLDNRIIRQKRLLKMKNIDNTYIQEGNLIISRVVGVDAESDSDYWAYDTMKIESLPILQKF